MSNLSDVFAEYMENALSDYYICYFDILGSRTVFEDNTAKHSNFLAAVKIVTADVKSILRNTSAEVQIKCKTYSDNFILYFEKGTLDEISALTIIIKIIKKIQIKFLLDEGLLLRGGVTLGEFFADEDIVFGKGLVRAVELEEKYAQVPRIIIDKENITSDLSLLVDKGLLIKDFDEQYFVNYFDSENSLKLIKGKCVNLINTHCKYRQNIKDPNKIAQTERIIRNTYGY